MADETEPSLATLPTLVMCKLFSKLAIADKKTARIVCQRWRQILDDPEKGYYKFHALVQGDSDAKVLMESERIMDFVYFGGVTGTSPGDIFPVIHNAVLRRKNSWSNSVAFLTYGCQRAKMLKIDVCGFETAILKEIPLISKNTMWQKLSSLEFALEIQSRGRGILHAVAVEMFLKALNLPSISGLSITISDFRLCKEMLPFFIEFYNFIDRHASKLKSLELILGKSTLSNTNTEHLRNDWDCLEWNSTLAVEINESTQSSISSRLKLTALKVSNYFSSSSAAVKPCLLGSTELSKLVWDWSDYDDRSVFQKILKRNETTLEELDIPGTDPTECLTNCPKLTTLCVRNSQVAWNSKMKLKNLKSLEVSIVSETIIWSSFLQGITSYFKRFDGFKKIEIIVLGTPHYIYDVQKVQEILALADFKKFVYSSWSNEHFDEIRTYVADIPDLVFTSKGSKRGTYDNAPTWWECTIKKKSNY